MSEPTETPDVEEMEIEMISPQIVVKPKEAMIHKVGKQTLGFAMAFVAEQLASVAYDSMLRLYRNHKYKV